MVRLKHWGSVADWTRASGAVKSSAPEVLGAAVNSEWTSSLATFRQKPVCVAPPRVAPYYRGLALLSRHDAKYTVIPLLVSRCPRMVQYVAKKSLRPQTTQMKCQPTKFSALYSDTLFIWESYFPDTAPRYPIKLSQTHKQQYLSCTKTPPPVPLSHDLD